MIQASIQNLKKKLLQFVFQFLYILNVVNCLEKRILMKNEWLEIETIPRKPESGDLTMLRNLP